MLRLKDSLKSQQVPLFSIFLQQAGGQEGYHQQIVRCHYKSAGHRLAWLFFFGSQTCRSLWQLPGCSVQEGMAIVAHNALLIRTMRRDGNADRLSLLTCRAGCLQWPQLPTRPARHERYGRLC